MTNVLLPADSYTFEPLNPEIWNGSYGPGYRMLVTGWRDWPEEDAGFIYKKLTHHAHLAKLDTWVPVIVVHGACPYGGVDLWAHRWCEPELGLLPEPVPAEFNQRGIIMGPRRNAKMVKRGADVCIAFPGPNSRGTIDCLTKARAAGIPTFEYPWSTINDLP